MLSRVANAIYWMNRYVERAENYARFMDVNFNLSLELPPDFPEQWKPLVVTTGDWELFRSMHKKADKKSVIYFLGFDPGNPNSVFSSIVKARENARAIRPEITKEVWEQINHIYYFVKNGQAKKLWQNKDPRDFFMEVKKGCQMLYGIFDATISRNDGWHFGKIGQMIERADKTSRVLDVKYHILLPTPQQVGSPIDLIQWSALLKSVSAYDMYRKTYGKLTPINISEFLVLDTVFPRAMLCCLMYAERSLRMLTGKTDGYSNDAEKRLGILRAKLEYANINDIFDAGLHEQLDHFQRDLNLVSSAIFETFFSIENLLRIE
jgi:uncharacterized alpha-E superfamily protein